MKKNDHKFYFDVGANNGKTLLEYAKQSKNNIVYAFEPVAEMIEKIKENTKTLDNFKIIPKAVSDYNGKTTFNVAGKNDWGCSSLHHFQDKDILDNIWGKNAFSFTNNIQTEVTRLDTFCKENNITDIEYIHIDAQGCDLEVLIGLGDLIKNVKAGRLEAALDHQTKLYNEQKYVMSDIIKFLVSNKFNIQNITTNNDYYNEFNIDFSK